MEIILIRHTRVGIEKGTCYGWSDVPLADTFETEALATKRQLETFGTFDAVFSSPLSRARKLADFCGSLVDISSENFLRAEWADGDSPCTILGCMGR